MKPVANPVPQSPWLFTLIALAVTCCGFAPVATVAAAEPGSQAINEHRAAIIEWRQNRHARLASVDGWLTLVGLEWLQDGQNTVGSGEENSVQLPSGPDYWGSVYVEETGLRFVRANNESVTVDGSFEAEVPMIADIDGAPTTVRSGTLSFYPIFRETYALRVKDSQAPTRIHFSGVNNYEIQWDWRIEGRFTPAEEGTNIEIANVLGQLSPTPVMGTFQFEREGTSYQLLALGDESPDSLWFIFTDRTNGRETYGAGRFLYSDGMPENGRLVVDFNKAYNPPCAFNDFSTCPLPPKENRLNLYVNAGEKDFHLD